ncbi:MAG: T9SS type A sorting domain-containing protein, partial [Saprospiraceae bacterium]|nr:T9SS type A sorting domain-containing protein [Saprospiraceae bacterium]
DITDDRILLSTIKFKNNETRNEIIDQYFSAFDFSGNFIEQFHFNDHSSIIYTANLLRNEEGIIVGKVENKANVQKKISFLKSNGKGEIKMVKELKLVNLEYIPIFYKISQLPDGDILIFGNYRKINTDPPSPGTLIFYDALTTIRINGADLDSKPVRNIDYSRSRIFSFPNPSIGNFNIDVSNNYHNLNLKISSTDGIELECKNLVEGLNTFHFNNFSSGLYLYQVFSESKLVYSGKWTKL